MGCLSEGFNVCYTGYSSFSQCRLRCAHTESSSGWVIACWSLSARRCHEELGLRWSRPVGEGRGSMNSPREVGSNFLQESEFIEGQRKALYPPPVPQGHLALAPLPSWATLNLWLYMLFYYLKRNWRKVSSQASFTSWFSFTQQTCFLGILHSGAESAVRKAKGRVCMPEVTSSCPCTHPTYLESQRSAYDPETPPFCLNTLFLFEWQPCCLGQAEVCICWSWCTLFLGVRCHGSELAGWGAQWWEGVPSEGLNMQPLPSPSPASAQSQILRDPGSLKLKSVANDCGKCGSGKWLCCTWNSWLTCHGSDSNSAHNVHLYESVLYRVLQYAQLLSTLPFASSHQLLGKLAVWRVYCFTTAKRKSIRKWK